MRLHLLTVFIYIFGGLSALLITIVFGGILLIAACFKCLSAILGASYQARKVPQHPRYWSRRRW